MSHTGKGRHGVWARQNNSSFSRYALAHGHDRAWQVFIGVDFSQLPPVPDVIREERELARRAMWVAKKKNDRRFNRLDSQLSSRLRAGLLPLPEYYEQFDALWAETRRVSAQIDADYNARVAELDAKQAEQAAQEAARMVIKAASGVGK